MARLCKSRVKNGGDDNYHIFLNSVEGISKIIIRANLFPGDCRIVCSQSADSLKDNLEKLPDGFVIQTTLDPVKTFNFYTSTCFEGQDIFDKYGRTFIVSEKHKDHTKVDVRTTLPQICGRIRDSRYKNEVTQIFSVSAYKEVTLEEYKESIRKFWCMDNRWIAYNMFFTRKEIFEDYCQWLFPMLEELERYIKVVDYPFQKRTYGFMGEILLPLYCQHNGLIIKHLPVLLLDDGVNMNPFKILLNKWRSNFIFKLGQPLNHSFPDLDADFDDNCRRDGYNI